MSRTLRFLGGLQFTLLNQALALLVGLWLTRFALQLVGREQYGLWLLGMQLLAYLALLDLGVVALLPREAAFAAASDAASTQTATLPRLVGETRQLALWQTPMVGAAALIIWLATSQQLGSLRPSFAIALAVYPATFPLRVYPALLVGLQDLAFMGAIQIVSWVVGTATTVGLLVTGHGLPSFPLGWAVTQIVTPLACSLRVRTHFPHALPRHPVRLGWPAARRYLGRSLWLSVGQIANSLEAGADVVVIATLLGPATVVLYVCTGKLIAVFGNIPLVLANTAMPALSDLRVRAAREHLMAVTGALTQAVLIVSGAVACTALVVNEGFVRWWVGGSLFGGLTLTVWLLVSMLTRHWGTTLVYSAYSFGHERLLTTIAVLHGVVSIGLMVLLVHYLGPVGAPVATVVANMAVIPIAITALMGDLSTKVIGLLRPLAGWATRFGSAAAPAYLVGRFWHTAEPVALAGAAAASFALYVLLMVPITFRPPLLGYITTAVQSVSPRLVKFIPRPSRS